MPFYYFALYALELLLMSVVSLLLLIGVFFVHIEVYESGVSVHLE